MRELVFVKRVRLVPVERLRLRGGIEGSEIWVSQLDWMLK